MFAANVFQNLINISFKVITPGGRQFALLDQGLFYRKECGLLYQGLILEGISGTGKTSVFEALTTHNKMKLIPAKSRLLLSEHHTQRILEIEEQKGVLTPQHHLALMDQLVTFVEILHHRTCHREWNSDHVQEHDLFYLFERFHLTHVFRFSHMNWSLVAPIDDRLNALGAKLCMLTVNAESLETRLFSRKHECWLNYLKQYGNSPVEVVETLMLRQQLALNLTEQSSLPTLVVDTSDNSIEQVTEQLAAECLPSVQ